MSGNKLKYASIVDYSPNGTSPIASISRSICGAIKASRVDFIDHAITLIDTDAKPFINDYLNKDAVLVPIPKSSPLAKGAPWPSNVIAEKLVEKGFAKEVYPCITRKTAIRKSSFQADANTRPSVTEHYNTLDISPELKPPPKLIVLVDDVVTAGRTAYACAQKIKEIYPDCEVRLLTIVRTQSFQDIESINNLSEGEITYYPQSGKTFRN